MDITFKIGALIAAVITYFALRAHVIGLMLDRANRRAADSQVDASLAQEKQRLADLNTGLTTSLQKYKEMKEKYEKLAANNGSSNDDGSGTKPGA